MRKNKQFIGIDGCRSGWLAAVIESSGALSFSLHATILDLLNTYPHASKYWIDMPMGLSEGNVLRDVENPARELLKPNRTSTIFTPPCRSAVYADTYEEAKILNKQRTGKSISIQAWNLVPKIRELDQLLLERPSLAERFYESHPEIGFRQLNTGQLLQSRKASQVGFEERMAILQSYLPKAEHMVQNFLQDLPRSQVKADDVCDALCLALSALQAEEKGVFVISGTRPADARGIPMRIACLVDNQKV